MNTQYRIVIPRKGNNGVIAATNTYAADMARQFGGVTGWPATGGWIDGAGALVTEEVTVLASATDVSIDDNRDLDAWMHELALRVGAELAQEAVYWDKSPLTAFIVPIGK